MRTACLAAVLLAAVLLAVATACLAGGGADTPAKKNAAVSLTIDYGDGFQKRYTRLPWREKMTVLDAMLAARKHRRSLKFVYRGRGSSAFLTQIDDLKNEGRGRNWIYRVNKKLADRSMGVKALRAGDQISWKFTRYQP